MKIVFRLFVVAAVMAACGQEQPRASSTLLSGIPVMPQALPVATAAGSEAVENQYRTLASADSVAAWYRRWLLRDGWRITGDARAPGGVITLHGEKGTRPVWLMIQSQQEGSTFSIVGADAGSPSPSGRTPGS